MFRKLFLQQIQATNDFRGFSFIVLSQFKQLFEVGEFSLEPLPESDLLGQLRKALGDCGRLFAVFPDVLALGLLFEIG